MNANPTAHRLLVRTALRSWSVNCRLVLAEELAIRLALLLREFLSEEDVEFLAAAEWAFEVRRAIESAGASRQDCIVVVMREGRAYQKRTIAEFAVAEDPAVIAGRVAR